MFLSSPSTSSTPMTLSSFSLLPSTPFAEVHSQTCSFSPSDSTVMKKLYRRGTVHPSPPPPVVTSDRLSFLPAAILTLAATLSPDEREVLAYLISCFDARTSFSNFNGCQKTGHKFGCGKAGSDHPPSFKCDCFSCYTSFWVRWDSSPNRLLIHEIIDAYEEGVEQGTSEQGTRNNRKERKKKKKKEKNHGWGKLNEPENASWKSESDSSGEASNHDGHGGIEGGSGGCDGEEELQKGSMRRLVSFLGEKVWGTWNRAI